MRSIHTVGYYMELALKEMRRHPVLAFLISLQLAMGIAAFVACSQQQLTLSQDPLPGLSQHIFHVQLDPRSAQFARPGIQPPVLLTYVDAKALFDKAWVPHRSMSVGGAVKVVPTGDEGASSLDAPFFVDARATTSDFFAMFRVPLVSGSAWGPSADRDGNRVAVIGRSLSLRLFHSIDVVGRTLHLAEGDYIVVGVADDWSPQPRFYDITHKSKYGVGEQVFLPFSSVSNVDEGDWGDVDCWADIGNATHLSNAPCTWVDYWVELPTAAAKERYKQDLVNYSDQQKQIGRYSVPPNVRLRNVTEWLSFMHAVPANVKFETWLSFGFLAVCLANTLGLLLAKFSRTLTTIGIRRALGASGIDILVQLMSEAITYGIGGGLLAIAATALAMVTVKSLGDSPAASGVTWEALAVSFGTSILCAALAAILPAWRCVRAPIHLQIKTP